MKNSKRKIHIDLTEETHKRLRIKAAIRDESIQKFVEDLIAKAVCDVEVETYTKNSVLSKKAQTETIARK